MAFDLATPTRGPKAPASDAGGSAASGLSDALASALNQLKEASARCEEAKVEAADLLIQLGGARAELKVGAELRELAIKAAILEAKQEARAEVAELLVERQGRIANLEAQWNKWRESGPQVQGTNAAAGAAPAEEPGAASAPEAPAAARKAAENPLQ